MPTNTQQDIEPQRPLLNAVRESQAAVIDVVRAWTEIGEQLTRDLRLPVTRVDLAEAVDRMFDVAEQTLAVQRQFALTVAGATTRQLETAVDTTVEAVEATPEEAPKVEPPSKAEAPKVEPPSKAEPPKREARPDRRSYEERSIEELRERARELEIEGRSSMSKDELISALRRHSR